MERDSSDDFFDAYSPSDAEVNLQEENAFRRHTGGQLVRIENSLSEIAVSAASTNQAVGELHHYGVGLTERWTREASGHLEQIKWILAALLLLFAWSVFR